jgi:hypothetical protein
MQDAMTEEGFLDRVVFSDESTFHISGRVHRLKILTRWCNMKGLPQRSMFFCAMSTRKIYGPLFFCEDNVTGTIYLEMLDYATG